MRKDLCKDAEATNSIQKQSTYECWILKNVEETMALGETLPRKIPGMKLLLIEGQLGAGKTSLVKGIGLGLDIHEPITSPTFSLAQHYPTGKPPLVHLDLYRIENHISADALFLQEEEEAEAMNALMIIEWPERMRLTLPDAWRIKLQIKSEGGRIAQLKPPIALERNSDT